MPMPVDVLIVDDSAAIRKILQRVLRQADVRIGQVWEAGNGIEALEVMRSRPVGLILSDVNMPGMDGIALLREVRATPEWKSVPFLLITTDSSQNKVLDAVSLGAAGYVKKPFTAEQIKEKLALIR
jgi:two-component system, chemotaxis family, chemotaxis protein CheY